MASDHHHQVSVEEKYVFENSTRKQAINFMLVGAALFVIGILLMYFIKDTHATEGAEAGHAHGASLFKKIVAFVWMNNVYFTGIAIIGIFFVSVQYAAQAGWSSSIKRIPEAFGYFLPFAGGVMLLTFLAMILVNGGHDSIFHWTHEGVTDKASPEYDAIIAGKAAYLNVPFFLIRMVAYFGLWYFTFLQIRKFSLQEDLEKNVKFYEKQTFWSVVFIVIFAVTSSTSAWDWALSIDTHWFSTMYGWYTFASWHVAGLATITLVVVLLKEAGYLQMVNSSHLHDLGKFMFAFSIFWAYIFISQFLLIYYAGIPEETIYFKERWQGEMFGFNYTPLFFLNLIVNFIFPFLALMTRDSKRHLIFLKVVAVGIIAGHWLDFYQMIIPGSLGAAGGMDDLRNLVVSIGIAGIYIGGFMLVVGTNLSKHLLIAKNHPMLEESMHHDI
ncbi:MAG: quinol:cytochrome C oxidoreductase [Verrucomicrobia bacterium]|nr:quinol:cytochrome C oxidoreductase [Cytophagales bacterium]